ncbi:MAG: DUF1016 family protein, partial [Neisseriaceae bacterium]|nr:DUF1016 family protein [Neisseriaceae bacterium]
MTTNLSNSNTYNSLIATIGEVLAQGKAYVLQTVNQGIVQTYWAIGKHIVEFEQAGNEKAEYGSDMLNRLSDDLTARYGKGFSRANVFYIRKLYMTYPKVQTLSKLLSWSHFVELLKIDDPLERSFYQKECENAHWGVRELKRQMKSMLFQRLALSKDKNEVMKLAQDGQIIEKPEDILKQPYIFEFTGLPQLPVYQEGDLEAALVENLSQFLLELGKGFAYIGRQQNIHIAGRNYKIDLVFYHRILK